MSATATGVREAPSRAPLLALLAVGLATAYAALAWGHPAATAAPVLLAAAAWSAWKAPLRATVAILAFLLLALDDSWNANGLWHTPLAPLGDLLRQSLRTVVAGADAIPFTGTEIALVLLLAVAAWRRSEGERVAGHVPVPRAVVAVGAAYLAAIGYGVAHGLARGGSVEVAVWQTRPLVVPAGIFLLFAAAFRGPADHLLLGKVVVAAAAARAVLALWVRLAIAPGASVPVDYVTDHGDSMLFTLACVALVAHLVERPDRGRLQAALLFLPLLLLGIHANHRRTAWVQLALGLAVFLVVGRTARWRREVGRAMLVALPVLVLYGAAGWSSAGVLFRPVQIVRSVVDSRIDRSTWDRQVENWNLAMSMRERPLSGRGFGHEWTEFYAGDDITGIFLRYRAQPHNQVLGILLFGGALAFAAIWAPFAVMVLLAARAYPRARSPEDRAAALWVGASAIVVGVQCFGDLGPFWPQYGVLVALALVTAGKLAHATGAAR
jgi:O-antigen ligase